MSISDILRARALGPLPSDPDSIWFPYFSEPWVVIKARMPDNLGAWFCASNDERRMFMLFVAAELESALAERFPLGSSVNFNGKPWRVVGHTALMSGGASATVTIGCNACKRNDATFYA